MISIKEASQLVAKSNDFDDVKHNNGDVWDIIAVVREADRQAAQERGVKKLAKALEGKNDFETCKNVWEFVKHRIPYVMDKNGYERIRKPKKTVWDAYEIGNGGDCKSFSVLIADLLRENGIKSKFRFISQQLLSNPSHVYIIAYCDNKEVIIDAVYYAFNKEPKYYRVWDYETAPPNFSETKKIGSLMAKTIQKYYIS
jgi:hypothetical protein